MLAVNFGHFHHHHPHHHTRTVVHHHHDHHSHHNAGGGLLLGGLLLGAVAGAAIANNNNNNNNNNAQVVYSPPAQTVHPQQVQQFAPHQAQARQHAVQVMGAPQTVQPVYNAPVAQAVAAPTVAIANCVACQAPIQFTRTGAACQVRCYNCPTVNTFY
jgi:hypothetical protein